jgi:hypothetical protein
MRFKFILKVDLNVQKLSEFFIARLSSYYANNIYDAHSSFTNNEQMDIKLHTH